jgi:hypothetical protein
MQWMHIVITPVPHGMVLKFICQVGTRMDVAKKLYSVYYRQLFIKLRYMIKLLSRLENIVPLPRAVDISCAIPLNAATFGAHLRPLVHN